MNQKRPKQARYLTILFKSVISNIKCSENISVLVLVRVYKRIKTSEIFGRSSDGFVDLRKFFEKNIPEQ